MKKGKLIVLAAASAVLCLAATGCGHKHTYGDWTVTTKPTLETGGVSTRVCTEDESHTETYTLPSLSDKNFWTETETKQASHTEGGVITYTSAYGSFTVDVPKGEHEYVWTILPDHKPTLTEGGQAKGVCNAEQAETTVDIPNLNDTSVWTKDGEKSSPASCTKKGKDVYVSKYGEVEVELAVIPHTAGDWKVTQAPTEENKGTATTACTECGAAMTKELPNLKDTSFWTKGDEVTADYNHMGYIPYTNAEFDLEVQVKTAEKKVAIYDNKTYFAIAFDINEASKLNKVVPMETSWLDQHVTLDANATGECVGAMFGANGKEYRILATDYDKGLLSIECDGKTQVGYLDKESGIFVQSYRNSLITNPMVATPFETDATRADCAKASAWTVENHNAIAITYTSPASNQSKVYHIFIYQGKAYFNVTFSADKDGTQKVAAEDCYNAQLLYVKAADGTVIASFAKKGNAIVEADGKEGTYTGKLATEGADVTLKVSGAGEFIDGAQGDYYEVAPADSAYTIGAYLDGAYYEITLNSANGTFTASKPMVTVTLHSEYDTAKAGDKQANKNVAFELPVLEDEANSFGGWFFDSACTNPVPEDFKPTANIDLYAKWAQKVSVTVTVDTDDVRTYYYGVGDVLAARLPKFGVEEAKNRYFVGWYLDAEFNNLLSEDAEIDSSDALHVYAKWETLPAYYGTFNGKQLLSGNTVKSVLITIDEQGKITGSAQGSNSTIELSGTVVSYDETTQRIVWQTADMETRYMWCDKASGLLVIPEYATKADMDGSPYVLVKDSTNTVQGNKQFDYKSGTLITSLVAYGSDGKLAFIYNNKIYSNISIEDAFGATLTFENVMDSKTLVVKDSSGEKQIAFGTTAAKFGASKDELGNSATVKALDNHYGVYTIGGVDYKLDGVGGIVWEGKEGDGSASYTLVSSEEDYFVFDVYTRKINVRETTGSGGWGDDDEGYGDSSTTVTKSYENVAYYQLKLAKEGAAHEFGKVLATVTYTSEVPVEAEQANVRIPFTLVVPDDTNTKVFRGWFENSDYSGDPVTSVTLNDATGKTLYAKWIDKVTVSFNLNYEDAAAAETRSVAAGETCEYANPKRIGYKFLGWFTAATEGDAWKAGETVVGADITVYAHWEKVDLPYEGSFGGLEMYNVTNTTGNQTLVIDAGGEFAEGSSSAYSGGQVTDYDPATQRITWTKDTNTYYFWFEPTLGLIASRYTVKDIGLSDGQTLGGDIYFMVKGGDRTSIVSNVGISYTPKEGGGFDTGTSFGNYTTRFITVKKGETQAVVLLFNDRFYTTFAVKTTKGETLTTVEEIKAAKAILVYSDEACTNLLFKTATDKANFGTSSAQCVALDDYYGEYTVTGREDKVVFDGAGNFEFGARQGTYQLADAGADYTFDLWMSDNKFHPWKMTITGEFVCTLEEPVIVVPEGGSLEKAQEITFTDDQATVTGETSEEFITYYIKLTVTEPTEYVFMFKSYTRVGGPSTSKYYARVALVKENAGGEPVVLSGNSYSFDDAKTYTHLLEAGTYYLYVHGGGNVPGNTSYKSEYDSWGSFEIKAYKNTHASVNTALTTYVLGSEQIADIPGVSFRVNVYYKVDLQPGKYKLTMVEADPTGWSTMDLYSYNAETKKETSVGRVTGSAKEKEIDISAEGAYYLVTYAKCKFKLEAVETPEPGEFSFSGKTYSYNMSYGDEYEYEVKFTDETSGTMKLTVTEEGAWGGDETVNETFTAVVDSTAKTITFKIEGKADIVATYTDTTIVFPSSCSVSDFRNKTLTVKA